VDYTQRELFQMTVNHQKHQEYLFYADFSPGLREKLESLHMIQKEGSVRDQLHMFHNVHAKAVASEQLPPGDFREYYQGMDIPAGATINAYGILLVPGSAHHFKRTISPLRHAERLDEVEKFPFVGPSVFHIDKMKDNVRDIHRAGKVASCGLGHMYEDAWQVRGYEPFLMDMMENPDICAYILDRFMERNMATAEAASAAGVDMVSSADDVANQRAMMFPPDLWRKFLKERWAKIYARVREKDPKVQIWYHSDGNITDILDDLVEIGVTILNPLQPECMDLREIKRRYGSRLVFDGTIGTQTTMPYGTPQEVAETVKERVRTLGEDGALILSPTHLLEPDVPVENVLAYLQACRGATWA
jgi:uroporphyrinogen decarboxylase